MQRSLPWTRIWTKDQVMDHRLMDAWHEWSRRVWCVRCVHSVSTITPLPLAVVVQAPPLPDPLGCSPDGWVTCFLLQPLFNCSLFLDPHALNPQTQNTGCSLSLKQSPPQFPLAKAPPYTDYIGRTIN